MNHLSESARALKPSRPITKELRFRVFERDGFRCRYCGLDASETVLHADHRHPGSRGGPTTLENLVTACAACNLGKSDRPLDFILNQQELAQTAQLYQMALEAFGAEGTRAWSTIYNACCGNLRPDVVRDQIRKCPTWDIAETAIERELGWNDDEPSDDVGEVI